jgi:hypothetical protein
VKAMTQGLTLVKIWTRHSHNLVVDLRLPESILGCPNKNVFMLYLKKKNCSFFSVSVIELYQNFIDVIFYPLFLLSYTLAELPTFTILA